METRAYRVVTTDDGKYRIERSIDGGKWAELYCTYRGDFHFDYLWHTKLCIMYFIYKDKQAARHKTKADIVVYGPRPVSKRKKGPVQ